MNGLDGEPDYRFALRWLVRLVCGLVVGAVAGGGAWIALTAAVFYTSRAANSDDPSAGSAATAFAITIPVGCVCGARDR